MDINQIAETVKQNIQGDKLVFSDETTGVPYIIKLFYYHMDGQHFFELNEVTCSLEAKIFLLAGHGVLPDGTDCHLSMSFEEAKEDSLQVTMEEQYLLEFPGADFGCVCSCRDDRWLVTFQSKDTVKFVTLIAGSLTFLGVSVSAACFGNIGTVSAFRFQFELPFMENGTTEVHVLEKNNFTNVNQKNYFSLYFETDTKLDLSGAFEEGNQIALRINSFLFEKFGARCGFSFRGSLKIWSMEIPFLIQFDGQKFRLSTRKDKEKGLKIPSINALGKIVGINNLNFPDSLSSLTEFEIDRIVLDISPDFDRLISFSVVVANANIWQLSQTPGIHITNIVAGFTTYSLGTNVFVGGDFVIAEWVATLSAAYNTQVGWIFQCYIANDMDNPLGLSVLFKRFCALLAFPEIPFSLPELKFVGAMITFNLNTKQFSAAMEIGRIKCTFEFLSVPKQSYCLDLNIGYEIALAGLPIVGTDLHLLDHAVIRNIHLISDSNGTVLYLDFAGKALKLEFSKKASIKELLEAEGRKSTEKEKASGLKLLWFVMEQKFSVFTIHRIGLGFDGQKISFTLDAELTASGFQMTVEGMAVSLEVKERLLPSFTLSGLSVGFRNPTLTLDGGFWHSIDGQGTESYDGALSIAVKGISILVAGSYSDGSFLAYGILRGKIGGPPAFFITGLAVGFGLNKYLKLPKIEEVNVYPLVAAAMKPDYTVQELLAGIKSNIDTLPGQNFLAAGIQFQSFGMAVSFALLTVSFGKHVEIALLGVSEITVPPMTNKDAIAKATLALKVALLPEVGVLSVEAQLMTDSYILSKNCRLTGGFAFFLWYAGVHKGDFVITLGGYRRGYNKPTHYPDVPRLGFCWRVIPQLVLSGEMYFALTPSALCAGGKLEAVFHQGALRAWFTAYVDIEIGWKPFYYELAVGVSLGASITLDFWLFSTTFTLEMSVELYIKGPEFGGKARVKWWVISFTISFGEDVNTIETIEWDEFKKTFLQECVISIQATEGKIGTIKVLEQEKEIEVLNADSAKFTVESLIPSSSVTVNHVKSQSHDSEALGVLPMGEVSLSSPLSIKLSEAVSNGDEEMLHDCHTELLTQNVPKALWAKQKRTKNSCGAEEELISHALTGANLKFTPKAFITFPKDSFLTLDALSQYEKIQKYFMFTSVLIPRIEGTDINFEIFTKVAAEIEVKAGAFSTEMEKEGFDFDFIPGLTLMAENAKNLFDEEMMISGGGMYGALD